MHFQRFNTHRINASLRVKLSSSWFRYSTSIYEKYLASCSQLHTYLLLFFVWRCSSCIFHDLLMNVVTMKVFATMCPQLEKELKEVFRGNSRENSTISLYFCMETIPARALLCNAHVQVTACCCMLLAPAIKH